MSIIISVHASLLGVLEKRTCQNIFQRCTTKGELDFYRNKITNKRTNERTNERTDGRTNKQTNTMKHKAIPDKQNTIKLKHEQKNKKQINKHTKTIKLLK